MQDNHDKLSENFGQLNQAIKAFTNNDKGEGVGIGELHFPSRNDLRVWSQDDLEDSGFPFGVFLDVYSFLGRIQTSYNNIGDTMLKNLDLNDKSQLT